MGLHLYNKSKGGVDMCTPALSLGLSAVNAFGGAKAKHDQIQDQINANYRTAYGILQSMNYSFQNLEQERQAAFASQVEDMTKVRMNAHQQEGSVRAAVNEELMGGGRTADMINRSVRADESRVASQAQANYQRKMNEIDLNKEATLINAQNQIKSIPDVQTPSYLSTLMDTASDFLQTYNTLQNINSMRLKAGVAKQNPRRIRQGVVPVNLDEASKVYDTDTKIVPVNLDDASKLYDMKDTSIKLSSTNFFNPSGLFAQDPVSNFMDMSKYTTKNYIYPGLKRRGYNWPIR